jgi:hypothetical protein
LGKKLINSPKYHLALCEIATLYEWSLSDFIPSWAHLCLYKGNAAFNCLTKAKISSILGLT